MGVLGWPPETFWRATLRELVAAIDGFNRRQGGKSSRQVAAEQDELRALMASVPAVTRSTRKFGRKAVFG